MLEHGRCLQMARFINDIVFSGSVRYVAQLRSLLLAHNQLFLRLYGAGVAKPKLHYSYHIPDSWVLFGVGASCFKPERDHRDAKAHAQHVHKGDGAKYLVLRYLLDLASNEACFEEYVLLQPSLENKTELIPALAPFMPGAPVRVTISTKGVNSPIGRVLRGDLVSVPTGPSKTIVAQALFFASAAPPLGDTMHFAFYVPCREVSAGLWCPVEGPAMPSPMDHLVAKLPYVLTQGALRPSLTWHADNGLSPL